MAQYPNINKQEIEFDDQAGSIYKISISDAGECSIEINRGSSCYQEVREMTNGKLLSAMHINIETGDLEGHQLWYSFENRIEASFHKNNLHGLWTMYDENNNILKQAYFENGYNIGQLCQSNMAFDNCMLIRQSPNKF